MNRKEIIEKFERNVQYLRRNVPPDDIYVFCEQTFLAALFFLKKWSDLVDMEQEYRHDAVAAKWVNNILGFQKLKDEDQDVQIDLGLDEIYEDDD